MTSKSKSSATLARVNRFSEKKNNNNKTNGLCGIFSKKDTVDTKVCVPLICLIISVNLEWRHRWEEFQVIATHLLVIHCVWVVLYYMYSNESSRSQSKMMNENWLIVSKLSGKNGRTSSKCSTNQQHEEIKKEEQKKRYLKKN